LPFPPGTQTGRDTAAKRHPSSSARPGVPPILAAIAVECSKRENLEDYLINVADRSGPTLTILIGATQLLDPLHILLRCIGSSSKARAEIFPLTPAAFS
jgi:hypothetical protein